MLKLFLYAIRTYIVGSACQLFARPRLVFILASVPPSNTDYYVLRMINQVPGLKYQMPSPICRRETGRAHLYFFLRCCRSPGVRGTRGATTDLLSP